MTCEEKRKLVLKYHRATSGFTAVVSDLQRKIGMMSKEEYERHLREVDQARDRSDEARIALERHIAKHDC